MSTNIDINFKANTSQATSQITNASGQIDQSLEKITDQTKQLNTSTDKMAKDSAANMDKLAQKTGDLERQNTKLNVSTKDLALGVNQAAVGVMGLYNSYDRVADMTLQVDRANLKAKVSAEGLDDAQRRQTSAGNELEKAQTELNKAIEKYGPNSEEAAKAQEKLSKASEDYKDTQDNLKIALERYDVATQAAKQTQDNYNEAIMNTALTAIPQVVSAGEGIFRTFNQLRDYDFSGLMNKFTGKGGISDAINSTGGSVGGLSSKLGGLNTLSFAGLLGAVAAIGVSIAEAHKKVAEFDALNAKYGRTETTADTLAKGAFELQVGMSGGGIGTMLGDELLQKVTGETLTGVVDRKQTELITSIASSIVAQKNSGSLRSLDAIGNAIKSTVQSKGGTYTIAQMVADSIGAQDGWSAENIAALKNAIPKFARGGIVTQPTIALIGEAGPEAIVPLKQGGQNMGYNINVNSRPVINLTLNGAENPEKLVRLIQYAVEKGNAQSFIKALSQAQRTYGRSIG